jgi:hypothetical protein
MIGSLFSSSAVFQPSPPRLHLKLVTSLSVNSTHKAQKTAPIFILNVRFISSKKLSRSLVKCSPSVAAETEAEIPIEKSTL